MSTEQHHAAGRRTRVGCARAGGGRPHGASVRSRRAQRSGVAGWLWQTRGRTFCMRTYGFGPRQSSHTMGKSLRSHPSASGSRSRRCAIGNGDEQLGATSRAAMQESSVLGKDACSGRSAPQKARNCRQTAMTRCCPLFGPSPVLFPRPVETRALCCRYARLAPTGRARTRGSCARVGLLRLGWCQSAPQSALLVPVLRTRSTSAGIMLATRVELVAPRCGLACRSQRRAGAHGSVQQPVAACPVPGSRHASTAATRTSHATLAVRRSLALRSSASAATAPEVRVLRPGSPGLVLTLAHTPPGPGAGAG